MSELLRAARLPRVDCPICGRSVALTVKGRLRIHRVAWWPRNRPGGICSGSQHALPQLASSAQRTRGRR